MQDNNEDFLVRQARKSARFHALVKAEAKAAELAFFAKSKEAKQVANSLCKSMADLIAKNEEVEH